MTEIYNPSKIFEASATTEGSIVQPISAGYDIAATRINARRREAALKRANGALSNQREKVLFYVIDFKEEFALGGTTGQGRRIRDFYPHNLILPVFTIEAQCLDQWDYGNVVEFVHQHHQQVIGNTQHGNLLQLDIRAGWGNPKEPHGSVASERPIMRGAHKPVQVQGIVEAVKRTHKQAEYAPVFTFSIAVVESLQGIYKNNIAEQRTSETWWQLLQGEAPFSQAPKPKSPKPTSTPKGAPATDTPTKLPTYVPLANTTGLPAGLEE